MPADDASPRRPHDPSWRSRTAHRSLDPAAARALRRARFGWSVSEASRHTGVSRRMIRLLEQGQRRPSASLAESLIRAYGMTDAEAAPVRAAALANVGRDSPYKRGWRPSPADYRPHQEKGRQPVLGPRRQPAEPPQDPSAPASWDAAYTPAPDGEDNPWAAVYGAPAGTNPLQRLGALRASPRRRA